MNKNLLRKVSFSFITIFIIFFSYNNTASASTCPDNASDCYYCGDNPCTKDCIGVWNDNAQDFLSCNCPQGEECKCYCPYVDPFCAIDPDCMSDYLDISDAKGYAVYVEQGDQNSNISQTQIIRYKSGQTEPLTAYTLIFPGDTVITGEEAFVRLVYDNYIINLPELSSIPFVSEKGEQYLQGKYHIKTIDEFEEENFMTFDWVRYDLTPGIRSEIIIENTDSYVSIKVLEGNVTLYKADGSKIEIKTGEQIKYSSEDIDQSYVSPYNFKKESIWWTKGYEEIECLNICLGDQTPFPGCSCIIDGNLILSDPVPDSNSGAPFVVCTCCCFVGVSVIGIVIVLLIILKKKR